MKNLFLAALLAVTVVTSAFASDVKKVTGASNNIRFSFKGATNITWSYTENFAKAAFNCNNQKMEAFYDLNGDLIATTYCITGDDLPVAVKRNVAKKYSNYTIKEAIKYEGEEDAYYVAAENEKESLILKIGEDGFVNVFKTTAK